MIGSGKVAIGLYGMTLLQWVMKRGRTVRGLIFDLIDATLILAFAFIIEAVFPQMTNWSTGALIACGGLASKYGTRLTAMFFWRLEHAEIEVSIPGVATLKSKPDEGDDNGKP